jgi:hypothetical protein
MPIRQYLDGHKFDPDAVEAMGVAFAIVRTALQLRDRGDLANEIVAEMIIAVAQEGERDPERISERVLDDLRTPPPRV